MSRLSNRGIAHAKLTPDQVCVEAIRKWLGLQPLYATPTREPYADSCGQYVGLEALKRAADPDCKRCGGSGYYDGEALSSFCPCTGRVKAKRGEGKSKKAIRRKARASCIASEPPAPPAQAAESSE